VTSMDTPDPAAGEEQMIAAKLRVALHDHDWHPVPAIEDRVEGYPSGAVAAVLARLVAEGAVERDAATDPPRYRLAPRG